MKHALFYRPMAILAFGIALFGHSNAWGHGIELFAAVEGTEIRGILEYHDGPPIGNAPIRAYDPDGAMISETTTGEDGRFVLPVTRHCDYRLVGDAGEGHLGSYTVKASELPETLPEGSASPPQTGPISDLDARIEKAVARQLAPLREQLFAYEKATRFRDVLGGIGYLFGLAGIVVLVKRR